MTDTIVTSEARWVIRRLLERELRLLLKNVPPRSTNTYAQIDDLRRALRWLDSLP